MNTGPLPNKTKEEMDVLRSKRKKAITFSHKLQDAAEMMHELGELDSTDIDRIAMGTFIHVLTHPDHPHWPIAVKEWLMRKFGKPADRLEVGFRKQLLEGITLVPGRPDVPLPGMGPRTVDMKKAPPDDAVHVPADSESEEAQENEVAEICAESLYGEGENGKGEEPQEDGPQDVVEDGSL